MMLAWCRGGGGAAEARLFDEESFLEPRLIRKDKAFSPQRPATVTLSVLGTSDKGSLAVKAYEHQCSH